MSLLRLVISCGLLTASLAGCPGRGSGTCLPSAELAPVPSASTAVFLARAGATGVSQLVLLDQSGTAIVTGPGDGSAVWARTGTALMDAPLAQLGSVLHLARGGAVGGATLLLPGALSGVAHVAVPAGAIGFAATLSAPANDALVVDAPDGSSTAFVAMDSGVLAFTRPAAGAFTSVGPVVPAGEAAALVGVGTAVLVLVTPPGDAPGASSLLVLDAASRAVVHRVDLGTSLRGCRTMALLPPTIFDTPSVDRRLGIACEGVPMPGFGRVGAGYALYVVGVAPVTTPRSLGTLAADVSVPRLVSAIVGTPGGTFVHAGATDTGTSVVWVDVAAGVARVLTSLAAEPPTGDDLLGAGAYDDGTRTLLWPNAATSILRWTVPPGAAVSGPPVSVSVVGCSLLPIGEIVALGAAAPTPGLDAGVPVDAGTAIDAGPGIDGGSELDAPSPGIDAPPELDAP